MISDRTRKLAKAKGLGIEGYRTLSDAKLDAAIAKAEGKAPAKGKTAPVAKGKTAAKVSTPVAKGKTATAKGKTATAPAAKSARQKSTPRASAAKGKATRQSGTTRTRTTAPGRKPATRKPAVRKPVAKAPVKRTTKTTANGNGGATISKDKGQRVFLDKSSIDWTVESRVGKSGKRKDVLDALRRYKGDYKKVFVKLAPNARVYYKKHRDGSNFTKVEAEKMLTWLIARVAYDFVMDTGQHNPGSRRAYGTAGTNGSATRTTATKRVAQAKKTTPARKPAAAKRPATRAKAAPAARKPAQRRTAAPAAKRGGKVTAGRR